MFNFEIQQFDEDHSSSSRGSDRADKGDLEGPKYDHNTKHMELLANL